MSARRHESGLGVGALYLLLSGTASTLLSKIIYQLQVGGPCHSGVKCATPSAPAARRECPPTAGHLAPIPSQGPGRDGCLHPFEKPWASTLLMFVGMAACLPAASLARRLHAWLRRMDATAQLPEPRGLRQPLLQRPSPGSASVSTVASDAGWATPTALATPPCGSTVGSAAATDSSRRALLLVLLPTVFDLVSAVLLAVGLLVVTASTFMMLRGSEIAFSALISTMWLGRRLNRWHLGGIATCMASAGRWLDAAAAAPLACRP